MIDFKALAETMKAQNIPVEQINSVIAKYAVMYEHKHGRGSFQKDTMPDAGYPALGGRILDGSPFSLTNETIFNGLPINRGGNAISNWLPNGRMKARKKDVQHLEFIIPHEFDISAETYAEWLAGLSIGECGYGPSADWSGFRYQSEGGTFSWSTQMLKQIEDGGLPYYESMPLGLGYNLQGADGSVMRITNDGDWALALILMMAEDHLNYVTTFGYKENSEMEWDGILAIVTAGYVQAHVVGRGVPHWADPLITDGSGIVTATNLLSEMLQQVRHIRRRANMKNWPIAQGDMIFYMSSMMWDQLAEEIAAGALLNYTTTYNFQAEIDIAVFEERLLRTRTGGFGMGMVPIDGVGVPVIVDDNMGVNSTVEVSAATVPAVTSDVLLLTRQAGNFQLWSHDFLDYRDLGGPRFPNESFGVQNGFGKAGRIDEANKCYFYYMEMMGRLSCNMLPLQARITSVSLPVLSQYGIEAPSAYSNKQFYPYAVHGSIETMG